MNRPQNSSPIEKRLADNQALAIVTLFCFAAPLLLLVLAFLSLNIWLPDVIFRWDTRIADMKLRCGHRYEVRQHWDRQGDGYVTEFVERDPSGTTRTTILEGAARKRWRVSLDVDHPGGVAHVQLNRGSKKRIAVGSASTCR
jgi:hypothetical protein